MVHPVILQYLIFFYVFIINYLRGVSKHLIDMTSFFLKISYGNLGEHSTSFMFIHKFIASGS